MLRRLLPLGFLVALAPACHRRAPAPPAPPVRAAAVPVQFKSAPEGATILVDGKQVGVTPATVPVEPGKHWILLRKTGYAPNNGQVSIQPHVPTSYQVGLTAEK